MQAKASMPSAISTALSVLAGVLLVQWWPALPPLRVVLALMCAALVIAWRLPRWRWLAWLLLGVAWAAWRGAAAMDARLPRSLEGQDINVTGTVTGLPQARAGATSFTLRVDKASLRGRPVSLRGRVSAAWYEGAPALRPCSRWHLLLRLKRPRGTRDPGGSDSERSALQRGTVATGYVRDDDGNRELGEVGWCVDRLRLKVSRGIEQRVPDRRDAALLQALAVGDTRTLSRHDWDVARANGVSHLIAISGFHVGVAALFGIWLARLVYGLWPRAALRLPCPLAQATMALLLAIAYSAMAGFGLATVRSLLMIAVVALARCSRRGTGSASSLALAMMTILLVDPLAVLSAGFWFSFIGVAFLIFALHSRARGWRAFLRELSAAQLVMTVALLPLTLWFFGVASLVGALSNLIAVPLVSFVIVPGVLLGMVLLGVLPAAAAPLLWLLARLVHLLWWLLERMSGWPGAHWYLPSVGPLALLLALLGTVWLCLPRGVPLRWLGLLLFLPLLRPPLQTPVAGAFQAWVLDVGQGLSVIVRTREHALVYDAGPRYPSGYDLGQAVVVPSLHALGIDRLDMLMISHGDNDHAGGARAVAEAFPHAQRYAGEPARMKQPMLQCMAGQSWRWDGVDFRVLNPAPGAGEKDNDRSCVLLVSVSGGRLLLTGDISSKIEPRVAAAIGPGPAPVLVVPHHGSKYSSSPAFIAAVRPPFAVVSAGWHNRFGHPRPEVVVRYARARVPLFNTAGRGAIPLDFPAHDVARPEQGWRLRQPRYWRE